MKDKFHDVTQRMINRYSERFELYGRDVKTLGWGDVSQQEYRFSQTLMEENLIEGQSILGIGCGFGDYLNFLKKMRISFKSYTGFDLNPDLINEAKKIHTDNKFCDFKVINILTNKANVPIYDTGIMLGLLNLKLKDSEMNLEFTKNTITSAFSYVRNCLIVDFISANIDSNYPKEDFIYYHDPAEILSFVLSLTPKVVLRQNYNSIPQREFMLYIYK